MDTVSLTGIGGSLRTASGSSTPTSERSSGKRIKATMQEVLIPVVDLPVSKITFLVPPDKRPLETCEMRSSRLSLCQPKRTH